jgi:hypothetical protein
MFTDVVASPDDYLFEVGFVKRGLVLTYDSHSVKSKGTDIQNQVVSTLSGIYGSIVVFGYGGFRVRIDAGCLRENIRIMFAKRIGLTRVSVSPVEVLLRSEHLRLCLRY